ncbi:MAG TPA: hypothetical protein VJJ23_02655 [Candidatus Nanoarchaeia archaeon]|nr:hypothetical protein [Candidatus Nanoarchaeia archaeon]
MDKPNVFFQELERLNERVWSITGYFTQQDLLPAPFGGYFFQDTHLGGDITSGRLVDRNGMSTIKGEIIPNIELSFRKIYDNKEGDFIHYEFKKVGNVFVGKYIFLRESEQLRFGGDAQCVIFPLNKLSSTHDLVALL